MRILNKRYRTNKVRTFWSSGSNSALRYLGLDHFGSLVRTFAKYKWDYWIRNFSMLDKLARLCICSQQRISTSLMVFPRTDENILVVREARTVLREEVIIFSWSSRGLSLIERNLKKWILSTKSSCIKRLTKMVFLWGLWCATEDIPDIHVVKAAWVKYYGDLTALNWRRWLRYCSFVAVQPVG